VLAGQTYGIDVSLVQEVVRTAVVTPVPLSRPQIAGLINLRGEVLPTVDLRRVLGRPDRRPDEARMHIVARLRNGLSANLLVDVVGDVVDVDDDDRATAMEGLAGPGNACFSATHKLEHILVIELDLEQILDDLAVAAA
jgi:purine-binding chemotaxis protein CheW